MKSAWQWTAVLLVDDREDSGGSNRGGVAAQCLGSWHWWWSTSSTTVVKGEDGVGGSEVLVYGFWRLVGQSRRSWVNVVDGSRRGPFFFFFFFFLVVCGLWGLWSEVGTDGGHQFGRRHWLLYWLGDEKLMGGCGVYTDCWGWFGFVKDLMGQILER